MPITQQFAPDITRMQTLNDLLHWAVKQFKAAKIYYGHGTDNAWDEAVALASHVLHLPPDTKKEAGNRLLALKEKQQIIHLIARRIHERIPAAYLTKEAWFAGLRFYVDERVLIPRSPLAELITHRFSPWIVEKQVKHILDLCTGSGCIAIACAKVFPKAQVDASDISADALTVAKLNVKKHRVTNRIKLIQSDLFAKLDKAKYDIIISNPPYVNAKEMAALPMEYQHEPKLGLAAGKDGLNIVLQILKQAAQHLTKQGILIVEVGNSEKALIKQFPKIPFLWLEFQRGDGGVFLLTAEIAEQIQNCEDAN